MLVIYKMQWNLYFFLAIMTGIILSINEICNIASVGVIFKKAAWKLKKCFLFAIKCTIWKPCFLTHRNILWVVQKQSSEKFREGVF